MNRYGLSRHIPEDIKRQVRQRDGFGCVVCGAAIIDYEHFDPEFRDAQQHAVEGIILLCVGCHAKKTRGMLSRQTIEAARRTPKAQQQGFSFGAFDIGDCHPIIVLGNITARNVPVLLRIYNENVFRIDPPEVEGGPFRLSANVYDRASRHILGIAENEWQTPTSNWDVDVVGNRISIRSAIRDIDLILRSDPPSSIVIERVRMNYRGVGIDCREGEPTRLTMQDGNAIETSGMELQDFQVGIDLSQAGLAIGSGGGSMIAKDIVFNPELRDRNSDSTATVIPFPKR